MFWSSGWASRASLGSIARRSSWRISRAVESQQAFAHANCVGDKADIGTDQHPNRFQTAPLVPNAPGCQTHGCETIHQVRLPTGKVALLESLKPLRVNTRDRVCHDVKILVDASLEPNRTQPVELRHRRVIPPVAIVVLQGPATSGVAKIQRVERGPPADIRSVISPAVELVPRIPIPIPPRKPEPIRLPLTRRPRLLIREMAVPIRRPARPVLPEPSRSSADPPHTPESPLFATHHDLDRKVGEGTFRLDLLERLRRYVIRIPPLRERVEDIPVLARHILSEVSEGQAGPSVRPRIAGCASTTGLATFAS